MQEQGVDRVRIEPATMYRTNELSSTHTDHDASNSITRGNPAPPVRGFINTRSWTLELNASLKMAFTAAPEAIRLEAIYFCDSDLAYSAD
jgi:hypothetical protein